MTCAHISLEEAEELLKKGYVFCGGCPFCMAENDIVDFTDYDGVGLEHRGNIPFYTFYKSVGDGAFAYTSVPAIRVSGLEEYFSTLHTKHR